MERQSERVTLKIEQMETKIELKKTNSNKWATNQQGFLFTDKSTSTVCGWTVTQNKHFSTSISRV